MLYYRRKLLLAVLEAFGGSVNNLKFQKYLFLIIEKLSKKHYHFIPYRYGCFSFESYNDKRRLSSYLKEDKNKWILNNSAPRRNSLRTNKKYKFLCNISDKDKEQIFAVKEKYGRLSTTKLLNEIYSQHPYYAINSEIVSKAQLSGKEKRKIEAKKPKQTEKCLFTIGYEGRSIDEYFNILIKNNIKVLCDVRKNPLSRKYGFSKHSLKKNTQKLRIEYHHIPELGIKSDLRKNLNTNRDYKKLFSFYENKILSARGNELEKIFSVLSVHKRIALTCFEAEFNMCHRMCVSSALRKRNDSIKIKHL